MNDEKITLVKHLTQLGERCIAAITEKIAEHTHKPSDIGAAPAYTYGTEDLVAGSSALPSGTLYLVYE